eukprot:2294528-Pleurochrysis_carterae.AAC.2
MTVCSPLWDGLGAYAILRAHATHYSRPIQASQTFRILFRDYDHCVAGVASATYMRISALRACLATLLLSLVELQPI